MQPFPPHTRTDHDFEPMQHNISVTWLGYWDITCLCGWRVNRGVPNKDTAELIGWLHLRRYNIEQAREFAHNRGIGDFVYG
jgi:hypothetical protein